MRLDELAPADIAAQLKRLKGAYPGTKMSDQDMASFANELQIATRRWSRDELIEAISTAIQVERYFPRISGIMAHKPRRQHTPEQEASSSSACRRCHREAFLAAYQSADGRMHQRYRCGCEPTQPGWHTEAARQASRELAIEAGSAAA